MNAIRKQNMVEFILHTYLALGKIKEQAKAIADIFSASKIAHFLPLLLSDKTQNLGRYSVTNSKMNTRCYKHSTLSQPIGRRSGGAAPTGVPGRLLNRLPSKLVYRADY
jgi:hypothetical protein